jgi:hypothetical protein
MHCSGRTHCIVMSTYRDKPLPSLVLNVFDRLSAVEYRYRWVDIGPWLAEAGRVVDRARDQTAGFVLAHRA